MAFKKFHVRKWLNKRGHHSTAAIFAEVRVDRYHNNSEATLAISDCRRRIELDFPWVGGFHFHKKASEMSNALYKLDTLIDTLTQFREALLSSWEEVEQEAARRASEEET
jgi:hypothetical protein